ncbi:outer membrane lipoprotein carrier protein LolA [Maridesulfovibrio sp.]|uniref:LolA family protein n=1 Tax=Maridesulfovibrio sp. TaxID=2795000 RepID=UPI002A18AEBE|nr:outer membrane lipoprotein carrier protein LolA [Maridesulfovibrio sp.]
MLTRDLINILTATALTLLLLAGSAFAGADRQEQFLTRLKSNAVNVHSISSDFEQTSFISLFQDKMISTGRFIFARPDNLRWEYETPFASGFLLKGNKGLRWDEAAKQPTQFSTESAPEMAIISEQILAWTTMNIDWLASRYTIKMTGYDPAIMELVPRSEAAGDFMSMIRIFFSADGSYLQAIELHEPGGDYTRIDFRNVKINGPLPDGIFERR